MEGGPVRSRTFQTPSPSHSTASAFISASSSAHHKCSSNPQPNPPSKRTTTTLRSPSPSTRTTTTSRNPFPSTRTTMTPRSPSRKKKLIRASQEEGSGSEKEFHTERELGEEGNGEKGGGGEGAREGVRGEVEEAKVGGSSSERWLSERLRGMESERDLEWRKRERSRRREVRRAWSSDWGLGIREWLKEEGGERRRRGCGRGKEEALGKKERVRCPSTNLKVIRVTWRPFRSNVGTNGICYIL